MLAMYALAGFGVTLGFHRLLTHKAFETPRPVRLVLAILGSVEGIPVAWEASPFASWYVCVALLSSHVV